MRPAPSRDGGAAQRYNDVMSSHPPQDTAKTIAGLTPARRRALDILIEANRPVGAYEMIDLMASADGKRPAPVSVYRALAFLLDNGLAHRLESKNAFVVCGHCHGAEEPVVFLICEECGEVKEATSPGLARELSALTSEAGFKARTRVVEIAGHCARCAGA
ncbi:Fur family transcriptional regulator [Methylocystis sp. JR02]|uniref:Fur family transcriptional regulator n=1 Tax=Methylocystis sp. JR02 TaxID=3046284 RepID=UPI0024B8A0C7|nr:Fur family transcriptional regulator [Methylocystis sp. JR02]MDJ0449176.1 Fur family transcriptional regulator [Methylocystis sp. JR02]